MGDQKYPGGYLKDKNATQGCQFCPARETNDYLRTLNSYYSNRWRNFAIMWGFITFNICAALFLYWLARVPKKQKVLDSPPNEFASRVTTKASKPAAAGGRKSIEGANNKDIEKVEGIQDESNKNVG
jgi:hypothetical protein